MQASANISVIHYPKRKKKHVETHFGVEEPSRVSVLDVVKDNLDIADRKTFIQRMIYLGEHTFGKDEALIDCFSDTITQTNSMFQNERLTGMLLCYNKYFIHMLEGDEDAIHHQIKLLFNHPSFRRLREPKVLLYFTHIKQRFITEWNCYYGLPPKLLGEIKLDCLIPEAGRQVYTCIRKFYNFVWQFVLNNYYQDGMSESMEFLVRDDYIDVESQKSETMTRAQSITSIRGSVVGMHKEPYRGVLPEAELLQFILQYEYTQTLRSYMNVFGVIPQRCIYEGMVWPVPADFIPYDIFTKPLQIVMDLPKAVPKDISRQAVDGDCKVQVTTIEDDDQIVEDITL